MSTLSPDLTGGNLPFLSMSHQPPPPPPAFWNSCRSHLRLGQESQGFLRRTGVREGSPLWVRTWVVPAHKLMSSAATQDSSAGAHGAISMATSRQETGEVCREVPASPKLAGAGGKGRWSQWQRGHRDAGGGGAGGHHVGTKQQHHLEWPPSKCEQWSSHVRGPG